MGRRWSDHRQAGQHFAAEVMGAYITTALPFRTPALMVNCPSTIQFMTAIGRSDPRWLAAGSCPLWVEGGHSGRPFRLTASVRKRPVRCQDFPAVLRAFVQQFDGVRSRPEADNEHSQGQVLLYRRCRLSRNVDAAKLVAIRVAYVRQMNCPER